MAYVVAVISVNSSGTRTSSELNRMWTVGRFSDAVAEAVGAYQKMVNFGSDSSEVFARVFDHDSEKLVAMSVSYPDAYQIESTLSVDNSTYAQSYPLVEFSREGGPLVFKRLEPKIW